LRYNFRVMIISAAHGAGDSDKSIGLKEPTPREILELSRTAEYDFRLTAYPDDALRARFTEWVPYYKTKWAIARSLQPASILEIGVRYGYSAAAFLDGCPSARYLGIDLDSDEFGGAKGAIDWANRITADYSAEFIVADSQKMGSFPGGIYDLIHVDGQQDGDGSFHDLELAIHQGRFVLADGFFWNQQNFQAMSEFLFRYRGLIEYFLVIPGYAGELLIKPSLSALRISTSTSRLQSVSLPSEKMGAIAVVINKAPAAVGLEEEFVVTLAISNQSEFVLSGMPPFPVHISYHWLHSDGQTVEVFDGVRSPLRPLLAQGTTRCFDAKVVSPSRPGRYILRLTLVQESVQWFDASPIGVMGDVFIDVVP
jgi:hypothetical protein